MTREEAKQRLLDTAWLGSNEDRDKTEEAVRVLITALEQESCEDCISRQAVLDIDFNRICLTMAKPAEMIRNRINDLPSVQPKTDNEHPLGYNPWQE